MSKAFNKLEKVLDKFDNVYSDLIDAIDAVSAEVNEDEDSEEGE